MVVRLKIMRQNLHGGYKCAISPIDLETFHSKPNVNPCGARLKVMGSPTSMGIILWAPWRSVQSFLAIHPSVIGNRAICDRVIPRVTPLVGLKILFILNCIIPNFLIMAIYFVKITLTPWVFSIIRPHPTRGDKIELKYTEVHHVGMFSLRPKTCKCCQNKDGLSICHNGPVAWALKSQYCAGQNSTSHFIPSCWVCSVLSRANPKRKRKLNGVPSLIWWGAKPLAHSHKGA